MKGVPSSGRRVSGGERLLKASLGLMKTTRGDRKKEGKWKGEIVAGKSKSNQDNSGIS